MVKRLTKKKLINILKGPHKETVIQAYQDLSLIHI